MVPGVTRNFFLGHLVRRPDFPRGKYTEPSLLPKAEGRAGLAVVTGDLTAGQAGPRHSQTHALQAQSSARPEEGETAWSSET